MTKKVPDVVKHLKAITLTFAKCERHEQLATLRYLISAFDFGEEELFAATVIPGPQRRPR